MPTLLRIGLPPRMDSVQQVLPWKVDEEHPNTCATHVHRRFECRTTGPTHEVSQAAQTFEQDKGWSPYADQIAEDLRQWDDSAFFADIRDYIKHHHPPP